MATPAPSRIVTEQFADQLERSFRGGAWHGPAVAEALAGVSAAHAWRRPIPRAHNIHELVFHIGFWLDGARWRIEGEPVTDLAPEADWPAAVAGELASEFAREGAWRDALARLAESHHHLHAAVLGLDDERLDEAVAGADPTVRGMLLGILQHNAYHAGQIALLARAAAASAP